MIINLITVEFHGQKWDFISREVGPFLLELYWIVGEWETELITDPSWM